MSMFRGMRATDGDSEEDSVMNQTPLTTIAPDIFRKRLLIEGFYSREITQAVLKDYFEHLTRELGLRTYGEPIIHRTSGQGKEVNEGYDGFVPLIDSGIYIAVWVHARFLSTILYTCALLTNAPRPRWSASSSLSPTIRPPSSEGTEGGGRRSSPIISLLSSHFPSDAACGALPRAASSCRRRRRSRRARRRSRLACR